MTLDIALVLGIIVVAMVLFSLERIPADVVSLGVLTTVSLLGLVPIEQAFLGFSNAAVITLLGLFILTAALLRTGVVQIFGRNIIQRVGDNPNRLLLVIMVASAVIGAFMSNTASTAFFIPVVLGIARKTQMSPSKLLMPLAFSSILSSSVTLVSTSTNIVVSGLLLRYELAPMGMFELAPVGVPILAAGLIYMYFIGRRLIPDRITEKRTPEEEEERSFQTEILILPESPWIGKRLQETALGKDLNLQVQQVVRNKDQYLTPEESPEIRAGDVLIVQGDRDEILDIKSTAGIEIKADAKLTDSEVPEEDLRLVEAIVLFRSPLIGRTLKGIQFRERYGVQVLAINRRGQRISQKISQLPLRVGDVLLVQGHPANIASLNTDRTLRLIGELEEKPPILKRAPLAIGAFVGALALATFNLVSFPIAVVLGVLFVFLTRSINPDEAYREVEWRALILIACMLSLGAALDHTGAAEYIASLIISFLGNAGPFLLLSAFFLLTVLLTQPMSNQAAAVVIVPIALQTAVQLQMNPRAFIMTVALAASCSYLTPLEPSCLMVYGPGGYRFSDFLKVGSLLTFIIYLITILMVPMIWPL
jgi:di/tricarboxylate transporter